MIFPYCRQTYRSGKPATPKFTVHEKERVIMVKDVIDFLTASRTPRWAAPCRRSTTASSRNIELIASENFVSEAVLAAAWLRCSPTSTPRATPASGITAAASAWTWWRTSPAIGPRQLFGADHANVQPHSGAQANYAVYQALCEHGRHRAGHEPGQRRPPDPRLPGELLRQELQHRPLRRGSEDPPHRL